MYNQKPKRAIEKKILQIQNSFSQFYCQYQMEQLTCIFERKEKMDDYFDEYLRNQLGIKKAVIKLHDCTSADFKIKEPTKSHNNRHKVEYDTHLIKIDLTNSKSGLTTTAKKKSKALNMSKETKVRYKQPVYQMKNIESPVERKRKRSTNSKSEVIAFNLKDDSRYLSALDKIKDLEKALKVEQDRSKNERKKHSTKDLQSIQQQYESKNQTLSRLLNEDEQYEKLKQNEIEAKTEAADLRYRLELLRKENDKLKDKNLQLVEDNTRLYNLHMSGENDKNKLKEELKHVVNRYNEYQEKSDKKYECLKREYENIFSRVKVADGYAKSCQRKEGQKRNQEDDKIYKMRANSHRKEAHSGISCYATEFMDIVAKNSQDPIDIDIEDKDSCILID